MKNFTKMFLAICLLAGFAFSLNAQNVGINDDGSQPQNSAMLDVKSSNKGLLIPRMTQTARNQIVGPANGLLIFQTDNIPGFYYYNGSAWTHIGSGIEAEIDPIFGAHAASGITPTLIGNWNSAYGWGNHAGLYRPIGYMPDWTEITSNPFSFSFLENNQLLKYNSTSGKWENWTPDFLSSYSETDPIFTASAAHSISTTNITNWNTAYSWGNHATVGYLTSFTETDPIWTASPSYGITSANVTNWNTAYSWGNHATVGYLTSFTETDPIWTASPSCGISNTNITNWNSAYGWGNHASAGYLTSFTETDPLWAASPSHGISNTNLTNWNTAYGWGNHASAGYLTSFTETDPLWTTSPSYGITSANVTNWNTAYGWGNHASAGYLTSFTETDPLWSTSPSFGISNTNITNWNTAYGWGNHATAGYLNSYTETDPYFTSNFNVNGSTTGDLLKFNGTKFVKSTPNFTENNYLYNTKYGVILSARNDAQTNVDFVLSPKGNGGILAQQPDGTTTGGNNRGILAVDLQMIRSSNTQVASGDYSVIVGGSANSITKVISGFQEGLYSVIVGGNSNNVSGTYSAIVGGTLNTASAWSTFLGGGYMNTVSGWYGVVGGGQRNQATGNHSFVGGGLSNTAQSYGESVLGLCAIVGTGNPILYVPTDRLFVVGNGTDDLSPSNALTILKNANTTIGGSLTINGNVTGTSLALPLTRGTNGQVITSNGSGSTSWTTPASGTVTGVMGTAPIASSGGAAPVISISAATSSAAGSMSADDKTKLDAITDFAFSILDDADAATVRTTIGAGTGNGVVTGVTGTAPIISSGGAAPVISISAATTSVAGSMSAADKTKLDGLTELTAGNGISINGSNQISVNIANQTAGDVLFFNGTDWTRLPVGLPGQFLQLNTSGIPAWLGTAFATLTTTDATSITGYSATSGGNITNDGGGTVTARGVCWSVAQNPTTALTTKTIDGLGTGIFTSNITGLTPTTLYYVRAYATNSAGTSYGNQVSFTAVMQAPMLTTTEVSNIMALSATSGGNVTFDGGSPVTTRGVCWSTSPNPTTANTYVASGNGTGSFSINMTGLTQNTTYHVRAYATNAIGTTYGNEISFTTLILPTLTTTEASNITATTATSGGNITDNGSTAVTVRGVCWSTSANPTTANSKTTNGAGNGSFTSSITSLTDNTLYYVRAYATSSAGTAYGNQISFTTFVPQVTNPTTGKIWMDRNLGASQVATGSTDAASYGDLYQFGRAADGHQVRTSSTTSTQSSTNTPGHPNFITGYMDWRIEPNLWQWQGVNGINNPCPSGFRIPTESEWDAELSSWGNSNSAGAFNSPLKLPLAGYRDAAADASLIRVGSYGYYWSSTGSLEEGNQARFIFFYSSEAFITANYRAYGLSVRCIKD